MLLDRLSLSLGYDVVLAPLYSGLGLELQRVCPHDQALVVSNPTVRGLHGAALETELRAAGRAVAWLEVPDGEEHKSLTVWGRLVEDIVGLRPDRNTPILAFGGGVVGDMAGFAAATVLRGLPLVQVPTTLLAMVDASVGGKTAVNTAQGKNLVGAFHQPRLVWAGVDVLSTLPDAEVRCGLGEGLKHAVLLGGEALAGWEERLDRLRGRDASTLAAVVMESVRAKAAIVEEDPHERGRRALLNLGHTLGHGIEARAGYGAVRHGEAVAIGLMAASRLAAELLPDCDPELPRRLAVILTELGLPVAVPPGLSVQSLVEAMTFDKKRAHGMVRLVLPVSAGDVRFFDAPESCLARLAELGLCAEPSGLGAGSSP